VIRGRVRHRGISSGNMVCRVNVRLNICTPARCVSKRRSVARLWSWCQAGYVPVWSQWGALPIGTTPGHNRSHTGTVAGWRGIASASASLRRHRPAPWHCQSPSIAGSIPPRSVAEDPHSLGSAHGTGGSGVCRPGRWRSATLGACVPDLCRLSFGTQTDLQVVQGQQCMTTR
jgi:hypothetical protein